MNLDVWRLISLYLPFNHLNINKEFSVIYDQSWFKNKLIMKYGDTINNHDWEWLYKRSLKSGQIFKYDEDKNKVKKLLSDEAIKISEIEAEWILSLKEDFDNFKIYLVLTFDGNLYSFKKFKKYISKFTLIDTDVINIDDNTYIKKNEWYVYPERKTNKIIDKYLIDGNNFLAVASEDNFICAITKDHFYCYGLGTGNLRTYDWTDNVNLVFSGDFLILRLDGSLIKYDPRSDLYTVIDIGPVKDIYSGCIKLFDGSFKVILKNHPDDISFHNINIKSLTNAIFDCGLPMLLANNNVYSTKDQNDLTLIHENVKNICGNFDIFFII